MHGPGSKPPPPCSVHKGASPSVQKGGGAPFRCLPFAPGHLHKPQGVRVLTHTSSTASSARTSPSDTPWGTPFSLLSPAWPKPHFPSCPETRRTYPSLVNVVLSTTKQQVGPTPAPEKQKYTLHDFTWKKYKKQELLTRDLDIRWGDPWRTACMCKGNRGLGGSVLF